MPKNDEKATKLFKLKHIFENVKNEPSKYLDLYFYKFTEEFYDVEKWHHEILLERSQVDNKELNYENFIEKCSLNLNYQKQQIKSKNDTVSFIFIIRDVRKMGKILVPVLTC